MYQKCPACRQTGFIHLAGMLVLLAGIVLGVYLIGQKQLFKPRAVTSSIAVCKAADITSLKNCFNQVNNNQTNQVEISSLITCSGASACAFTLNNINRQVIIYGSSSGAGLSRVDTFTYPLLAINGSNHLLIKNLKFEENASGNCTYPIGNCASTISIANSSNIFLDQLTIKNSKAMGVAISNVHTFYMSNSTIDNVAVFGIWLNNNVGSISSDVHIVNNLFTNNQSNAILFSANAGTTNSLNSITGNTFTHNHRNSVFHVCGSSGSDPCSGGQLLIEQYSSNVQIANNIIQNGSNDYYSGVGTSGIEFSNTNVASVTLSSNDIHDNTGAGIYANSGLNDVTNISITGNRIYNVGWDSIYFPTANIANNCTSSGCPINFMTGSISGSPNPCFIPSGSSQCSQTINWTSSNASSPQLKVGSLGGSFDGLFSVNASGSQIAPWITSSGAQFNLYSGNILVASTFVFGSGEGVSNNFFTPTPTKYPRGKSKKWN